MATQDLALTTGMHMHARRTFWRHAFAPLMPWLAVSAVITVVLAAATSTLAVVTAVATLTLLGRGIFQSLAPIVAVEGPVLSITTCPDADARPDLFRGDRRYTVTVDVASSWIIVTHRDDSAIEPIMSGPVEFTVTPTIADELAHARTCKLVYNPRQDLIVAHAAELI